MAVASCFAYPWVVNRLWLIIICAAILAPLGWSQTAIPISGEVISQYGQPVPGAQVRVCLVTSSGTPCTPTTPIFQDYGLSIPSRKPDAGRCERELATVYAPPLSTSPALYLVQVNPQAGTTYTYTVSGGSAQGPVAGCNFAVVSNLANLTCSGTGTFNAVLAKTTGIHGSDLRCVAIPRLHREWGCRRF